MYPGKQPGLSIFFVTQRDEAFDALCDRKLNIHKLYRQYECLIKKSDILKYLLAKGAVSVTSVLLSLQRYSHYSHKYAIGIQ